MIIASLEEIDNFSIGIGSLNVPPLQTCLSLYVVVLSLVTVSIIFYEMARPWLKYDERKVPYAWTALGVSGKNGMSFYLCMFVPTLIAMISASINLVDLSGGIFLITGLITLSLPSFFIRYSNLIANRTDERGGPATFSIYLLNWLRLFRSLVFYGWLLFSIFTIIPKWETSIINTIFILLCITGAFLLIRLIGGFKFVYRKIDKFGSRYNFPKKSSHYN